MIDYLGYTSEISGMVPSLAISSSMRGLTPVCTISMETRKALRMATGEELPWRDDGDALHSQQGAAAYGIRREARLHGPERTGRTGRSHHPEGIRLEFHFKPFAKCLGRGFTGFQQNIAGKSVRQHYVYFVLKEIVAFHIAHKFKGEHAALLQMLQQCKSAFGEIRSFFVLGTRCS